MQVVMHLKDNGELRMCLLTDVSIKETLEKHWLSDVPPTAFQHFFDWKGHFPNLMGLFTSELIWKS